MKRVFLLLLLACCLLTAPAVAAGGSGTAADPYVIQTPTELQSIQNNLGAYYKLANDINLQGVSFTPIGSTSSPFTGSFDGAGYTISNLVISSSTISTGFFSCISNGAHISDITFDNAVVTTEVRSSGIVIGVVNAPSNNQDIIIIDNVVLRHCSIVSTANNVGCLIGYISNNAIVDITNCNIDNCISKAPSAIIMGGYIGRCYYASSIDIIQCTVTNSYFEGQAAIGCFVGQCSYSSLNFDSCTTKNSITNGGYSFGHSNLLGHCNYGSTVTASNCNIENCISRGSSSVGGLFGLCGDAGSSISANNCNVIKSTIISNGDYSGGILGGCNNVDATAIISSCDVSDCTILANNYAAAICPYYV